MVCFDCGSSATEPGALLCGNCRSPNLTVGHARPYRTVAPTPSDRVLPEPWTALVRHPAGSICTLTGGPGMGKTSLAAIREPRYWLTSEETVSQASTSLMRLQGAPDAERWEGAPEIIEVLDTEDLEDTLGWTFGGLLVLDSLTQVGNLPAQQEAFNLLEAWVRAGPDRRVLIILGHTKDKQAAGAMRILHQAQACCSVRADSTGLRMLTVSKNRHGPLSSRYFTLGAHGVEPPTFPYAYSVEGEPGAYQLCPWPNTRAKWAGILDLHFGQGAVQTGVASAGKAVPGYPGGVQHPADVAARKQFAEDHGLRWLG